MGGRGAKAGLSIALAKPDPADQRFIREVLDHAITERQDTATRRNATSPPTSPRHSAFLASCSADTSRAAFPLIVSGESSGRASELPTPTATAPARM